MPRLQPGHHFVTAAAPPRHGRAVAALAGLIVLLAAARLLPLQTWLAAATERLAGLGAWGPILFILLYVAACVAFIPASLLTLGAGAVFGLTRGIPYVWAGATLGATAAFLTGRYVARGWVESRVERDPRFSALDQAVAREGFKIVFLTRLSPLFPFTLLNYAFGLTRVRLRDYVAASALGMLPGTALYVYLGSLAGDLAGLGRPRPRSSVEWAFSAIGLASTFGVTWYAARLAARALKDIPPAVQK